VRDRKRVAFDRLLARLAATAPDRWLLKGGFALDLRLAERARTTKDVDIDWQASEEELIGTLIDAADRDMGDFFSFSVERTGPSEDRLGGSHRFKVLAELFTLDAAALRAAIDVTFNSRGTHHPPRSLPPPPEDWRTPYRQLARDVGIAESLDAGHAIAAALLDPILDRGTKHGQWSSTAQSWTAAETGN
jgi:hypothetical protein